MWVLLNIGFHGEVLLPSRPTPKLEDHPSLAVRDCLFNLFAASLHIGGRSSIRNLRTLHAVVTGTHLSHGKNYIHIIKLFSPFRSIVLRIYYVFCMIQELIRGISIGSTDGRVRRQCRKLLLLVNRM